MGRRTAAAAPSRTDRALMAAAVAAAVHEEAPPWNNHVPRQTTSPHLGTFAINSPLRLHRTNNGADWSNGQCRPNDHRQTDRQIHRIIRRSVVSRLYSPKLRNIKYMKSWTKKSNLTTIQKLPILNGALHQSANQSIIYFAECMNYGTNCILARS